MDYPRLVCPNSKGLLQRFRGRTVAIKVNSLADAADAAANVLESGNQLLCVIVESNAPLEDIDVAEDRKRIPLALFVPSMGKFRNLTKRLKLLRECNVRVYLSCDEPDNVAALRILSSMGIHTCAVVSDGSTDWDALADLMTFAVLERVPHASIEPFSFIASHYDAVSWLKWGRVYFDDPERFLHLDADGRIALSRAEAINQQFAAESLAEMGEPGECPSIKHRAQAWKEHFLDNDACATCPGWKVCLGRFSAHPASGCSGFFEEITQVAGQYKALKAKPENPRTWQP